MPEIPTPHEGENFVAEQELMTREQQLASEIREKRLRALGKDGHLQIQHEEIGHGVTQHVIRGTAKGHAIYLECSTFDDDPGRVLRGTIDGKEIEHDIGSTIANKLWDLYEPIVDDAAHASNEQAQQSLRQAHEVAIKAEKKAEHASAIDELLSGNE